MNCAEKLFEPILQFIQQATIEFRFQKSLAQERFKSTLEFRYQIIVSSIKCRKDFEKFMIPIALFKKFLSYKILGSVVCLFVWFDSLRPLNNLSVMRDGSSWVEPVLS